MTRVPAALLAGAYLLYPALGFLVLNEFHPVALATPLLLWAFLYVEEGRWLWALPFLVLAAACKETVPLVIGTMGAVLRDPQAVVAAADPDGRGRRLLRRRGVGDHPALQRRPERLHRPLRRLRNGRRGGGQDGAHSSGSDRRRPDVAGRTSTTGSTCFGRSASRLC